MFIIEPEIGNKADVYSNLGCKIAAGVITDKKNSEYLIDNIWFPIYRIKWFEFGGIRIYNDKYLGK